MTTKLLRIQKRRLIIQKTLIWFIFLIITTILIINIYSYLI